MKTEQGRFAENPKTFNWTLCVSLFMPLSTSKMTCEIKVKSFDHS